MSFVYPKHDPANCHGQIIPEDKNIVTYYYHGEQRTAKIDTDLDSCVLVHDEEAGWLNLWRDTGESK